MDISRSHERHYMVEEKIHEVSNIIILIFAQEDFVENTSDRCF